MEQLTEQNRGELTAYLSHEPEYNIFILGDLYNFGFSSPMMELYALRDSGGDLTCVLLRYLGNYVFYSRQPDAADAAAVAAQIHRCVAAGHAVGCISGKQEAVERLIPYFPDFRPQSDYLASLRQTPVPLPVAGEPRRLVPAQAGEIIGLYLLVEEFAESYRGQEEAQTENTRINLEKGGRCYGIHVDGRLVAVASTSAESDSTAMVIGVCTHPHYRGRGYASALVAKLCADSLAEGRTALCLFYDNPAAGRIYRRIGFVEMGRYLMLKPIPT